MITQGSRELRTCPFLNLACCFKGVGDDSKLLSNILFFFIASINWYSCNESGLIYSMAMEPAMKFSLLTFAKAAESGGGAVTVCVLLKFKLSFTFEFTLSRCA